MKLLGVLYIVLGVCQGAEAKGNGVDEGYQIWSKERIRYYLTRVQLNPNSAPLHVQLANAYYADGQLARARDELLQAVAIQPKLAAAHCNLAVVLEAQGALPEAKAQFEEAVRQDSILVEARLGLGTLLCRLGQAGEGLVHLERALELDPQQQGVRYDLGVAYYRAGDFKRAIEHLEKVLADDALYSGAALALGHAYYHQGLGYLQAKQAPQALECFARSLQYWKGDEDFFYAKGLAHVAQQQFAAAEAAFKETVRLQEGYMPAFQELATLCERTQRPQEAEYYLGQAQKWAARWPMIQAARTAQGEVGAWAK